MNSRQEPATQANGDDAQAGQSPDLTSLLNAAAQGDERAWRSIVDLYARRVYALARSRLWGSGGMGGGSSGVAQRSASRGSDGWVQGNDAAEEVTQSVFVTIAGKLRTGEYTEQGRFESWLFRVAMNRVRDEIRRVRRHATPTDPETLGGIADSRGAGAGGVNDRDDSAESVRALRLAMEHLSDQDREVVELRHHAGLSFKQIADMLEEPLGTLLARHHRALKKLKDELAADPRSAELAGEDL